MVENFKEKYLELKDMGLMDCEIADALNISHRTVVRYKRREGIEGTFRTRRTNLCITEEQLKAGEAIGLTRRLMYQRIRAHNWEPYLACKIPNMGKGGKRIKNEKGMLYK